MQVTNVVIAGLGGQGVLRSSDILAQAAFESDLDVKKAEVHGMSQRGGSVSTDVRFGSDILSPMVPDQKADYLVVLEPTQVEPNKHRLKEGGVLITPDNIDVEKLKNKRSLNIALLGVLSKHIDQINKEKWIKAIKDNLPEKVHEVNEDAFDMGRE